MIDRPAYLTQIETAVNRAPITALLGPRQCGKTTLARLFSKDRPAAFFDLESRADLQRLQNPELVLSDLEGLVVLDEIQQLPRLFNDLRVLVDQPANRARYLILGSASPSIVKNVSETLAGRVEFVELTGFDISEIGIDDWKRLWARGGYPRSFLADTEEDSSAWREGFVSTFLQRDIPQLGFSIPSPAVRRFWTMLAHYHGQIWNASELARSMGLSDKTVRSYLDILTGTYMVRQLQPWYENIRKRQVKAPKIYFRDTGLLHALLNISDLHSLWGHPNVGASWEGFAIEQVLLAVKPRMAFFWATHGGAKIDLFFLQDGKRLGVEVKFNEAPKVSRSMHTALSDLKLDQLWIIYPGEHAYPIHDKITVWPLKDVEKMQRAVMTSSRAGGLTYEPLKAVKVH